MTSSVYEPFAALLFWTEQCGIEKVMSNSTAMHLCIHRGSHKGTAETAPSSICGVGRYNFLLLLTLNVNEYEMMRSLEMQMRFQWLFVAIQWYAVELVPLR